MNNIAVIDLGSNTFHLLVAYVGDEGQLVQVHRHRVYARLARTGIGLISEVAFQEGLEILQGFKKEIIKYQVQKVKVVGTEMLRLAPNGNDFVQRAKELTGFEIDIISGQKEAEYIYMGVRQLWDDSSYLIMDIGGGSVEFILVREGIQKWMASFPIGVAVLYFRFHIQDPISDLEMEILTDFLDAQTIPLAEAIRENPVDELVGSSGVFDTFFELAGVSPDGEIDAMEIREKLQKLIRTTYEERMAMEYIPKMRKKMIIVASVLLHYVLCLTSVKRIRLSPNSLKEGLLYSMIEEKEL